jgi:ketosteroid isomerase-like protein
VAVAAGLVLAVVAAVLLTTGGNRDQAKIRTVVNRFAAAVQNEDQARIVGLLCAEEAADITEDDDYDPAATRVDGTRDKPVFPVHASNIRVTGDVASARVTSAFQRPTTLYFRKERGTWKVCASAAARFRHG